MEETPHNVVTPCTTTSTIKANIVVIKTHSQLSRYSNYYYSVALVVALVVLYCRNAELALAAADSICCVWAC